MKVGVDARALLAGRGVARFTRGLLAALAEGHGDDEWLAFVPGRARIAPVHPGVTLVRHRIGGRFLFGAAAVARRPTLAGLLGGVDVAWLPAPAPVAPGAPYVLTVHDRSWERRPRDFSAYERAWHRLARPRELASRAAAVTADSHAVAAELRAAWGVQATVVSPGVDSAMAPGGAAAARPARHPAAPPARHPAGPPARHLAAPPARHPAAPPARDPAAPPRYLLFVGPDEPRKGLDVLRAAHGAARARGLDAELVVVGDGLRRVDDRELAALYAGALAVVAPSHLEGFGLPPLEAAAHGTPAVVSDLACFAETLGDAALRVPVGDAGALADALLRVGADDALRASLGADARERAARYTWERAAAALHPLLARAAA
jgi:glycosyltransferase involved in cell wall biosynthesis